MMKPAYREFESRLELTKSRGTKMEGKMVLPLKEGKNEGAIHLAP